MSAAAETSLDVVDAPLVALSEAREGAHGVVECAFKHQHITREEHADLVSMLAPESPHTETLAQVRSLVMDLWALVAPTTLLAHAADKFLRGMPPTRGGIFSPRRKPAPAPSPRADLAIVRALRARLEEALERKILTPPENAMLDEQLVGDCVTEADVETVTTLLDARWRSARLGAREHQPPKGRGMDTLKNVAGRAGAPK